MARTMEKLKVPAVSMTGVAFGLTTSEFISEFVARSTGQVGWAKFGLKAGIKLVLGTLYYGIATRVAGMWSLCFEMATFGTLGSIIPDFMMAWNPGGVIGWAESAAVAFRGMGKAGLPERLREIERGAGAPTPMSRV